MLNKDLGNMTLLLGKVLHMSLDSLGIYDDDLKIYYKV